MFLVRRQNYRNVRIDQDNAGQEEVSCRLKSGEVSFCRWAGFLDLTVAKILPGAKPVKLIISSYGLDSDKIAKQLIELKSGSYVQGCYLSGHNQTPIAFAVIDAGKPRII